MDCATSTKEALWEAVSLLHMDLLLTSHLLMALWQSGIGSGTNFWPWDIREMDWALFVESHTSVDMCTFPFYDDR